MVAYLHTLEEERDGIVQHITSSDQLRTMLQTREDRIRDLEHRLQDAKDHLSAIQMTMSENVPNKISFQKYVF